MALIHDGIETKSEPWSRILDVKDQQANLITFPAGRICADIGHEFKEVTQK